MARRKKAVAEVVDPVPEEEVIEEQEEGTGPDVDDQQSPWEIIQELEKDNVSLREQLELKDQALASTEQLPEAGGIAWTEVFGKSDGHDVKINITSRGFTTLEALEGLLECIGVASEQFKLKPYRGNAKATTTAKALPSTKAPKPAAPGPAKPAPAQSGGAEDTQAEHVLNVVRFETQPVTGGKTKCSFYADNRQYPDLYVTNTPEQLAKRMSTEQVEWTPDHFKTAEIYDFDMAVVYTLSTKLNSKGNPYKDVVRYIY